MCTVTYLPTGNNEFVLTTNRDEAPGRSPRSIDRQPEMLLPRDTGAGGTWVAAHQDGRALCVLNGAFQRHRRNPPYRLSRGLVALSLFSYKNAFDFFGHFDFGNIEPFTMVIFDRNTLLDFRWDGQQRHIRELNKQERHIWSSATLYGPAIRQRRVNWFQDWASSTDFSPDSILAFHRNAGEGDPWNDVIMNRYGLVKTVSTTQVIKHKLAVTMRYYDLLRDGVDTAKINLEGEKVVETN